MTRAKSSAVEATNGAESSIIQPFVASFTIVGIVPYLYHRWNVEAVDAKAKAAKGSKAKKEDDVESYVYRDGEGYLGIPSEQVRMAMVMAAKYKQDPRSPRKSAMDIFKAGIAPLGELCSLKPKKEWDYLDRRRVMVQRNGITRVRPALLAGWQASFDFDVVLPEYITPDLFNEVLQMAGRLCGLGDMRPTYGRFQVTDFKTR